MKIATSNTIEGITKLINTYWYSDKYSVDPETYKILHPTKELTNFQVRYTKGKFVFESISQ